MIGVCECMVMFVVCMVLQVCVWFNIYGCVSLCMVFLMCVSGVCRLLNC